MRYELKKWIWTEADFESMNWLDNKVYKIRLNDDLEMDIDYIFRWNQPEVEGFPFTFWIAPSTLVFKNVKNISLEFVTGLGSFDIEDIQKHENNQWIISTYPGKLQFNATGFNQYIRQSPTFQFGQTISYAERRGYSLEKVTNQDMPHLSADVIKKREKAFEHYEKAKKRHLKKIELKKLIQSKENNKILNNPHSSKKMEITEAILSYDCALKGTIFEAW